MSWTPISFPCDDRVVLSSFLYNKRPLGICQRRTYERCVCLLRKRLPRETSCVVRTALATSESTLFDYKVSVGACHELCLAYINAASRLHERPSKASVSSLLVVSLTIVLPRATVVDA